MNFKKLISAVTVFLLMVCLLPAYTVDEGFRDPDSQKRRDDDYVGVIIKTNVEEAEVYINGKIFGTTPVATVDLSATNYNVEIRKPGYDTIRCRIRPRKYYTSTYIFVMEKTCGYIKVRNVPDGAAIYIDGSRNSSNLAEVDPGNHTVKVRKFGYEDFYEQIYVENHKTTQVDVSLRTAPFTISQFKVSKTTINPNYTSSLGKTNISFYVTNDGSAMVLVNDRYGNTVWSYQFTSFSTWEQGVNWTGYGSDGETLPDGQYVIKLISFDYEFSQKITIDRSMVYPLTSVTSSGSGIGTMPYAFGSRVNYVELYSLFGTSLNFAKENPVTCVPISAGLVIDFAHHMELTGSLGVDINTDSSGPGFKGGVSLKGQGGFQVTRDASLNFMGVISYNYCQTAKINTGYFDGNGLALGGGVGIDVGDAYVGLTGQYMFGASLRDSDRNKSSDVVKYGLGISFLPTTNIRTSVWGAMHNDKYMEAGAEIKTMPSTGGFCFNAKVWVLNTIEETAGNKNMNINAQIGLSYLF